MKRSAAALATRKMFDTDRLRERRRRQRQRVSACCRQVAAFLFSQVGLASMVVAYHIMGGFLFRALEAPFEQRVKVGPRNYVFVGLEILRYY